MKHSTLNTTIIGLSCLALSTVCVSALASNTVGQRTITIKNATNFEYICARVSDAPQGLNPSPAELNACSLGKVTNGYTLIKKGQDYVEHIPDGGAEGLRWAIVGVKNNISDTTKSVSFANPLHPTEPQDGNVVATTVEATYANINNAGLGINFDVSMVNGANFGVVAYPASNTQCDIGGTSATYSVDNPIIELPKDQSKSLKYLCNGDNNQGVQTGNYFFQLNNIDMCAGVSGWVGFNDGNLSDKGRLAQCSGPFGLSADYCREPDKHITEINQAISNWNTAHPQQPTLDPYRTCASKTDCPYGKSPLDSAWENTVHSNLVRGSGYAFAYDDKKGDASCETNTNFVIKFTSPGTSSHAKMH